MDPALKKLGRRQKGLLKDMRLGNRLFANVYSSQSTRMHYITDATGKIVLKTNEDIWHSSVVSLLKRRLIKEKDHTYPLFDVERIEYTLCEPMDSAKNQAAEM